MPTIAGLRRLRSGGAHCDRAIGPPLKPVQGEGESKTADSARSNVFRFCVLDSTPSAETSLGLKLIQGSAQDCI